MHKSKTHKVLMMGFLTFMVSSIIFAQPVGALSDWLKQKYSNYQIYFFNEEQCKPGTTKPGTTTDPGPDPDPDWEKWNGSCSAMTDSRIEWVKKYVSAIQTVASSNGLPWEMIPAQVFQESGGGKSEACDNNPLGLKASPSYIKAGKYCNVQLGNVSANFAKFDSYEDAFQYYADTAAISKVKNKYPNNPYLAVSYMQSGKPPYYAVCDSEKYSQCVGHMGEPTPGYVNTVSSIICGIQKWAQSEGISISSVTWENYSGGLGNGAGGGPSGGGPSNSPTVTTGAAYCGSQKKTTTTNPSTLEEYVLAWAWPTYQKDKTERKPAYAEYIDKNATYKGACGGVDCGAFVANIIKASGWDTSYPQNGTAVQKVWLPLHWQKVDANSLKLGDVGIKTGHVILYVGNISGFGSKTASASQCDRAPMAGSPSENLNNYTWYRKK